MPIRSTPGHGVSRRCTRLGGRHGVLIPWSGSAEAFQCYGLSIWDRVLTIELPAWPVGVQWYGLIGWAYSAL